MENPFLQNANEQTITKTMAQGLHKVFLGQHVHSPHEIINMVCDFPYKIIEKCFQENALNIILMAK